MTSHEYLRPFTIGRPVDFLELSGLFARVAEGLVIGSHTSRDFSWWLGAHLELRGLLRPASGGSTAGPAPFALTSFAYEKSLFGRRLTLWVSGVGLGVI